MNENVPYLTGSNDMYSFLCLEIIHPYILGQNKDFVSLPL